MWVYVYVDGGVHMRVNVFQFVCVRAGGCACVLMCVDVFLYTYVRGGYGCVPVNASE